MKVLILGVNGLIGHKLFQVLNKNGFDSFGTIRKSKKDFLRYEFMQSDNIVENIQIDDISDVNIVLNTLAPEILINCVGITIRKPEINDPIKTIAINSLFPHQLAVRCAELGIRMIHLSTDCVFSGKQGMYTEDSVPDALDMYGRTKALGEVRNMDNCLTLRSSFIGTEISDKTELLEWFLAQKGKTIRGYTNAMYSGVSTTFLSSVIMDILCNYPKLSGLYQIATDTPISKYDLLKHAQKAFNIELDIQAYEGVSINKSLSGEKLKKIINFNVPSWEKMLQELAEEDLDKR
ncbi:MAG: SDR family oxidoreductase [Firmicutes bacterium]|jgi:dTDP-4-dehydrorhamnose reductase|nr:SDR family oxidoreductase [Bacillota bacterium]